MSSAAVSPDEFVIRRKGPSGLFTFITERGGWTHYQSYAKRFQSEAAAKALLRRRSGEIVKVAA